MKKLIVLLIIFLMSGICYGIKWTIGTVGTVGTVNQCSWYKPTRHKLVKRMKRHQVRKVQKGHNYYAWKNGKVKRNR